jgi:hypothetical protein
MATIIARNLIGVAVSIAALLSTPALAQRVSYDARPGKTFIAFKTFGFKEGPLPDTITHKTTTYDSPFVIDRTKDAVASQLTGRGLKRNDETPDVYVTTLWTFKPEYTLHGTSWGRDPWGTYGWMGWGPPYGVGWAPAYGVGWGVGPAWSSWHVDESVEGTLTIDVEDAKSGELVWRGVGVKHVHRTSKPAHRTESVNNRVEDIFKKFPATRSSATTDGRVSRAQ